MYEGPHIEPAARRLEDRQMDDELELLRQAGAAHFWPPRARAGDLSETGLKLLSRSEGVWYEDAEGRRYLDVISGTFNVNIGHGRREVADAVARQMTKLTYTPQSTVSAPTVRLAKRIASLLPDPQSRVYFTSGGSEAVETALKMARKYHLLAGQGTRYKFISRRGSLHGGTWACMSLGSHRGPGAGAPTDYGPLMPGALTVPEPVPSRCGFCKAQRACNRQCAEEIERVILHEGPSTIAAVIGEPISVTAGWHLPDPGYWREVRRICDKHGVLLIFDEILTGFGRTGRTFAMEHYDAAPDITVVAKGLGCGYFPIGAAAATQRVADAFIGPDSAIFDHAFTLSGNPLAAAAGNAVLDIIEREGLVERSRSLGEVLYQRARELQRHPIVGDVRGGKGLLCAIDLVRDASTQEPFPESAGLPRRVRAAMFRHGLLARGSRGIFLAPPLSISDAELDELLARLEEVLTELVAELR